MLMQMTLHPFTYDDTDNTTPMFPLFLTARKKRVWEHSTPIHELRLYGFLMVLSENELFSNCPYMRTLEKDDL